MISDSEKLERLQLYNFQTCRHFANLNPLLSFLSEIHCCSTLATTILCYFDMRYIAGCAKVTKWYKATVPTRCLNLHSGRGTGS